MAKRLRISGSYNVNIHTFTVNIGVFRMRDWHTQLAGDRVIETFELVARGTNDEIMDEELLLSDLLYEAIKFHEQGARVGSVWLEVQAEDETNLRRALIYNAKLIPTSAELVTPLLGNTAAFFQLVIERHFAWETGATTPVYTDISSLGGLMALTVPGGTLDGRMPRVQIGTASGGPLHKFWVGVRPTYEGYATFNALWECEAGTNYTDASDTADAGDSGNSKVRVSFATETGMVRRVALPVSTFVSTSQHALGRYLVLLRGSVTSGVAAVQLRSGFGNGINDRLAPNKTIYVSNTTDQLIELGEVSFPPIPYRSIIQNNSALQDVYLQIWAERISGAGSLDLDCLVLIPAEHFFFTSGGALSVGTSNAELLTFEDDTHSAAEIQVFIPRRNLETSVNNWKYPQDGGFMVIAAERDGSQVDTDTVDVTIFRARRWRVYAPLE